MTALLFSAAESVILQGAKAHRMFQQHHIDILIKTKIKHILSILLSSQVQADGGTVSAAQCSSDLPNTKLVSLLDMKHLCCERMSALLSM